MRNHGAITFGVDLEEALNHLEQLESVAKTVVAAHALTLCVQSGTQGAIMVPTEILAEQHYLNFCKLFVPLGINVALLINSVPQDAKAKVKEQIKNGEVDEPKRLQTQFQMEMQ